MLLSAEHEQSINLALQNIFGTQKVGGYFRN